MANQNITDSTRNPNMAPVSNRRPSVAGKNPSDQSSLDADLITESQRLTQNLSNQTFDRNRSGQMTDKNLPNQHMDANMRDQRLELTDRERLEQSRNEEQRLPVIEETLQVGKREVERGGVRVQSKIVETPVDQQINLREEHVRVERKPVNRPLGANEMASFKEGTIELHERAEEAVIAKQARVIEEVVVGKEVNQRTQNIHETVRHTEVSVDRLGGELKTTAYQPFESFDTAFRQDWTTNYASQGGTYDHYAPLYRYGYNLATSRQFAGKDWSSIETDARGAWEEKNPNTWDKVKAAVRHGWDRVTGKV